eukprot:GEMP01003346.1.p1 GENE.GEMP01003346.1~~GEMP01003346.1.p1  ORF type:complete len:1319 (+),score=295.90 GEMP01003346.1:35-3991(+)
MNKIDGTKPSVTSLPVKNLFGRNIPKMMSPVVSAPLSGRIAQDRKPNTAVFPEPVEAPPTQPDRLGLRIRELEEALAATEKNLDANVDIKMASAGESNAKTTTRDGKDILVEEYSERDVVDVDDSTESLPSVVDARPPAGDRAKLIATAAGASPSTAMPMARSRGLPGGAILDHGADAVHSPRQEDGDGPPTRAALYKAHLDLLLLDKFRGDFRQLTSTIKSKNNKSVDLSSENGLQSYDWDYVLVFPNPGACKNRPISRKAAEKLYRRCFCGEESFRFGVSEQSFRLEVEVATFLEAFDRLRPYKLRPTTTRASRDAWSPPYEVSEMDKKLTKCYSQGGNYVGRNRVTLKDAKADMVVYPRLGEYWPWAERPTEGRILAVHPHALTCTVIWTNGEQAKYYRIGQDGFHDLWRAAGPKERCEAYHHQPVRNESCSDFLTLLRNVVIAKLVFHLNLTVETVFSRDYRSIYLLVSADEADLEAQALRTDYPCAIDMMLTDFESFEPCTDGFHPLADFFFERQDAEVITKYTALADTATKKCKGLPSEALALFYQNNLKRLTLKANKASVDGHLRRSLSASSGKLSAAKIAGLKASYLRYLSHVTAGKMPIRALREVATVAAQDRLRRFLKHPGAKDAPLMEHLRCLWDVLNLSPATKILTPYSKELPTGCWKRYEKRQLSGAKAFSVFSATDRLILVRDIMARQVDIINLVSKGHISDFFPVVDYALKNASFRPMSHHLLLDPVEPRIALFHSRLWDGSPKDEGNTQYNFLVEENKAALSVRATSHVLLHGAKDISVSLFTNRMEHVYYGQRIGLYFVFVRHFAKWSLYPAIIGTILQGLMWGLPTYREAWSITFATFLTIWAPWMLVKWKKVQLEMNLGEGKMMTSDLTYKEPMRIGFHGSYRRSPITSQDDEIFFSAFQKGFRIFVSASFSLVAFSAVMISVVLILSSRKYIDEYCDLGDYISSLKGINVSQNILGIANAFQIVIFNWIYKKCARKLTKWENHRTYSEFVSSYVIKMVVFQFTNAYGSLFYIAFAAESLVGREELCTGDLANDDQCILDLLHKQLMSLFLVAALRNFLELGVPIAKYRWRRRSSAGVTEHSTLLDYLDEERMLESYGPASLAFDGSINDYLELVITFGYLVLFGIAFPIAGLVAYVSLVVEISVDSYKLRHVVRRPIPQTANSIGVWLPVFNMIVMVSCLTNATILVSGGGFKLRFLLQHIIGDEESRVAHWLVFLGLLVVLRSVINNFVPFVDSRIRIADSRLNYVLDRVQHPVAAGIPADPTEEKFDFIVKDPQDFLHSRQGRWSLYSDDRAMNID